MKDRLPKILRDCLIIIKTYKYFLRDNNISIFCLISDIVEFAGKMISIAFK